MPPVVTDQHLRPGALGGLAQTDAVGQRVGDRLLDQHRHAGGDAFEALVDVHLLGRGEDHAFGPDVRFYRKLGWQTVGEQFDIPTAGPHFKMSRLIPT